MVELGGNYINLSLFYSLLIKTNTIKQAFLLKLIFIYYSKAMEDGTEEYIQAMLPDKLPSDIQKLYDASHK